MRLSNDTKLIRDEFGFDPIDRLLFTAIRRDSNKIAKPIIAEIGSERLLLARQQETASVLFSNVPRERVRFHSEWVTFDRRIVADYEVSANLAALVAELAAGEPVSLAPGIVYAHWQELDRAGKVTVSLEQDPADAEPVVVYSVSTDSVRAKFQSWREAGVEFATGFTSQFTGLDGIESYFTSDQDTRFTALADTAADLSVDAFYLGAPPNFSEVSAVRETEGLGAVWVPGSDQVFLITSATEFGVVGTPVGRYESRAAAVRSLVSGNALAVEEEWMTASLAQTLEDAGFTLANATKALSSWRDLRDVEDLPFQVIAARASTHAMESALEKLAHRLADGDSSDEATLYNDYLAGIHEFRLRHEVPFAIEPYFANLHASDRTLFPTTPTNAPITRDSGCVELDTGVKITIDGVVVATSDMGRSLPISAGAQQAYATLTRVIREEIIPSIRPGVVMSDVHAQALVSLTAVRGELEEAGLLHTDTDFLSWYQKRNVGHLMGKQESFANELRPGFDHVLRVGDYGAAETPWRFGNIGISTEDLWFIGTDRTFTLTLS